MTERQPEPYGHDALDGCMDDLINAVLHYGAARILENDSPLGPSHVLEKTADRVKEARRKLRAHVAALREEAFGEGGAQIAALPTPHPPRPRE